MRTPRVTVIGAGVAGLAATIDLAARGADVTLLDSEPQAGGKVRQECGGIDAGPTVFTMRWVFDALFERAGASLDRHITLRPLECLARHAWSAHERLDLFADIDRSADAIGRFAGPREAAGYRDFCRRTERIYRTLESPFLRAPRPTMLSLATSSRLPDLVGLTPFSTLWRALGDHFQDQRLRQLFGRYATYSGSSPFQAPATLMLIAHVEQQGVWTIDGGMAALANAMTGVARTQGATIRLGATAAEILVQGRRATGVMLAGGERIDSDAIISAVDTAALSTGLLGQEVRAAMPGFKTSGRSLSAITWAVSALASGFPLARHNVFFSSNYVAEFDAIFRRHAIPHEPTVYICAQDRTDGTCPDSPERLLILINAPATGGTSKAEIEQCTSAMTKILAKSGLTLDFKTSVVTTPAEFARRYPATGGALYGQAIHGPMAAFRRPGSRSRIPGLYLAGGSVHPGPGLPMATLSGQFAAAAVLRDLTSA
jgi:1-hydroxycarotenoid 3,4-desaturase